MKLLLTLLTLSAMAWPQAPASAPNSDVNARYQTKEGRKQIAATLANPERDKTQKPEQVIAAMNLKPGMTVADIGTGIGYMLPHLSKAVGPSGKVLAEDIQTDFLNQAKAKAASEKLSNISFILGSGTSPNLPAGAVDVELVLDVYHHFVETDKMLAGLAAGLKPNGRLVIVEYHKANSPTPGHIKLEWSEVEKQVEANGFKLLSKIDRITDRQYMLTFAKK
jgi:ubiquinone/menaquinone biosynthesis C-methylase UbiE